ncbi:MAG: helix-turn-helix domain-containing protein, partial [Sarcina sp.]
EYDFEIDFEKYYTDHEEVEISKSCNELGIENIAQLKKSLPREIKYESIRAIILKEYILNK